MYYFDMAYRYSLLSADSILTVIENEYGKDSLSSSNLSAYYSERLILSEADGSMMEKGTVQVLLNDYLRWSKLGWEILQRRIIFCQVIEK